MNVVDVIITTRRKATEEQVFKDKEPRKTNSVTNREKEEWLKSTVKIIQ